MHLRACPGGLGLGSPRIGAPVPYRSRRRNRTVAVPEPYRARALAVPKLQVALQFGLAKRGIYQALSLTRSGVEIASQAEYAGSIPVIGSAI